LFGTSGGVVRQKPDITAADGVATSGNSLGAGLNPFSGTSAAAPHAGAIAALIKSANPALTPAQMRTILTAAANTIPVEVAGAGAARMRWPATESLMRTPPSWRPRVNRPIWPWHCDAKRKRLQQYKHDC